MSNISRWLNECHVWLQHAVKQVLDKKILREDDIGYLAGLCFKEANDGLENARCTFPDISFGVVGINKIRLCIIKDVKNINALAPRRPLNFGNVNLSIIYGRNGSGKSGYVRILKHACGAKNPGEVYPNIYAKESLPQTCKICFENNGISQQSEWTPNHGTIKELRSVDIFDSARGRTYIAEENEATYEPPELIFFSELSAICMRVGQYLDNEMAKLISSKPLLPTEYSSLRLGKWYEAISTQTAETELINNCNWTIEDKKALAELRQRLAETSPDQKVEILLRQKQYTDELVNKLEGYMECLSGDNCRRILSIKKELITKREAAETVAENLFNNTPLKGVGTDVWKRLWEHARRYSTEYAYEGISFPNTGENARCVLCQQPLLKEAKSRFQAFEAYIVNETNNDANLAQITFDESINMIGDFPSTESIKTKYIASGLPLDENEKLLESIYYALNQRKDSLLKEHSIEGVAELPDCRKWLQQAEKHSTQCLELANSYQEDMKKGMRESIETAYNELRTKKWLYEQREAIELEIQRLKKVSQLELAKKLTNTHGLSQKKGELSEILITKEYIQRFNDELEALGANNIRVELVKNRVERGHVLHKIKLKGNEGFALIEEIISEGEYKIIALAAFITDVLGNNSFSAVVLDDPVSSLDQDYEEAVAKRLTVLAKDRQIVVFTHKLSLLSLIQEYGRKNGMEMVVTCLRKEPWGTGEPTETPICADKPDKVLNRIINDNLSKAKKRYESEGYEKYYPFAKTICGDFRILIERMIESVLLSDIVCRFRRSIETKNKINKLSRITTEDCKYFDDMMTKYSCYEHSSSDELPVELPRPDELGKDLNSLRSWYEEFKDRASK